MGRTKSWLALVLAIVMVLGMAVPSAFAAAPTEGTPISVTKYTSVDGTTSTYAGGALTMNIGDDPSDVLLWAPNGQSSSVDIPLTEDNLGLKPTITFDRVDETKVNVKVGGDGYVTVTPVGMTTGTATEFDVYVQNSGTAEWGRVGATADTFAAAIPAKNYFKATIKVTITPEITRADANEVILDLNPLGAGSSKVIQLGSNPTGKTLVITDPVAGLQTGGVVDSNASSKLNAILSDDKTIVTVSLATGAVVGSGTLTISGTIATQTAKSIVVPYRIVNSAEGKPYKVVSNAPVAGYTFKRNDGTASGGTGYRFTPTVQDAKGTTLDDGYTVGTSIAVSVTPAALTDLIAVTRVSASADTFAVKFKTGTSAEAIASAKGKITVTLDGAISSEIDVVINPMTLSVGKTAFTLDLDKRYTTTLMKQLANLTVTSPDADALDMLTVVATPTTSNTVAAVSALVSPKFTLTGLRKGSGVLTVNGTINGIATDALKVNYTVIDSTPVPVITSDKTITLDIANTSTPKSKDVVFTASGSYVTGDAANKAISLVFAYDTDAPSILAAGIGTASTSSSTSVTNTFTAGTVAGTTTVKVSGTVDLVPIEPYTITVVVKNSTAGAASSAIVTEGTSSTTPITKIEKSATTGQFTLSVKVVDSNGAALEVPVSIALAKSTDAGSTDPLGTLPAANTTGVFVIPVAGAGKGKLTITPVGLAPIVIPVTINALTVTADPKALTLDLKDTDSKTGKITLKSADGTVTAATAAMKTGSKVGVLTDYAPTFAVGAGTFTFTGLAEGTTTIAITGIKVDGYDAEPIEVEVTVGNSAALKPDKDKYLFDMRVGGIQTATMTLTPNPTGTPTGVKVVSNDTSLLTVTKVSETSWTLKALKVGENTLTITGQIGGSDIKPVSVPFSIVNTDETQTLVVSPTSVALDLTSNKAVELKLSASGVGTVTEGKIVYTGDHFTFDGLKITAAKVGSGTFKVTAKIDGVDVETVVSYSITETPAPVTGAGVYIDGVLYADGDKLYIPNDWKAVDFKVSLKNADGAETSDVTLGLTVTTGNGKARLKIKNTNQLYPTLQFGKTNLTVTPKTTGFNTTKIVLSVQRLAEVDNSKVVLEKEDPQAGTRGFYFDYITTNTDKAYYTQPKFWKFTSGNTKRAVVKSNGIIEFKKAGKVTLKATKKSGAGNNSKVKSFSITLTITDEYVNTASWVAVLSDNTKAADVLTTLKSQNYPKGTTGTDAPFAYTEAGYRSMIDYLQESAGENDVSAVYIGGTITKDGVALSDKNISLVELANDLAKVKGKIFLTLNGAGSTLYSSKDVDATPADIAKVFAAAEAGVQSKATALSTVGTNGFWSSQKFYVLSATQKKSQSTVSTTKADAVEEAFITALTLTDGKFFNDDTSLTLRQLYNKVRTVSKKTIGYYPSAVKGVAVGYNYVP